MSTHGFPLSTSPQTLLALSVDTVLPQSKAPECVDYASLFTVKSSAAEAETKVEEVTAWRLLAEICRMGLQAGSPNEPFQPMCEGPDGRSLLPADLDRISADAVRQLGLATEDPELRARLLDIAWERLRDHQAARQAVRAYMDAADRLFDPEHWVGYVERTERALRLARHLRDQDLSDAVLEMLERKIIELDGTDPLFMTSRLMELLREHKRGDPHRMGAIARKATDSARARNEFHIVRAHLENLSGWCRMAGDHEGERDVRIELAESYVSEADLHAGQGGELLAASLLEQAHHCLRNIPAMRARANEIYERLRKAQRRTIDAMQKIRTEGIDLTELIKAAREHVSGQPFRQALLSFATVIQPTKFDEAEVRAQEMMKRFPLQGLMGGARLDRDGRVVAHRTVAIGGDEAEARQALWERVVEQVVLSYQLDAQAMIAPALNQLMFEHALVLRDLRDLVINNPLIPPGREELFARGFLAGFRWNLPEALSILIPQLENALRHLLTGAGAEITRRDKHGLQTLIQMGEILGRHGGELERLTNEDIVKDLKVLFVDQHGPDLRNAIAHGSLDHQGFYDAPAIYTFWFILFLCINPVHTRFRPPAGEGEAGPAPRPSD